MSTLPVVLFRRATQTVLRRQYAQTAGEGNSYYERVYKQSPWLYSKLKVIDHANSTSGTWEKMFFFVCCPAIALCTVFVLQKEAEHKKHARPEWINAPWKYQRCAPFPWGDGKHSIFHNPITNTLPDIGYETEDPNAGHGH